MDGDDPVGKAIQGVTDETPLRLGARLPADAAVRLGNTGRGNQVDRVEQEPEMGGGEFLQDPFDTGKGVQGMLSPS